jgi:hypothetical protein
LVRQYVTLVSQTTRITDGAASMEFDALAAFGLDQIQNMGDPAKEEIGDAVPTFAEFDIEVRKEFLDPDSLLLGGVGSFEALSVLLGGAPPTPE